MNSAIRSVTLPGVPLLGDLEEDDLGGDLGVDEVEQVADPFVVESAS